MKNFLFILLVTLTLGACKKNKDVAPQNPVELVAGRYKLSSFTLQQGGQTVSLPGNGQKLDGVAELTRSDTDGYVQLLLTVNGSKLISQDDDLQLEVRQTGKGYGLFEDTDQYGDVDGSNIIFRLSTTDDDGQPLSLSFVGAK